jgi:hypothetical protein
MAVVEVGRDSRGTRTRTGIKTATMARSRGESVARGRGESAPYGEISPAASNSHRKLKLLTRHAIDGRTQAAKFWDRMIGEIENDLGGHDQLSTIERTLIAAYVSAALTMQNLNTRLLCGEEIDFGQHSQAVSAMTRVASRLGIRRRSRDVTPDLDSYLKERAATTIEAAE